MVFSLIVNCLFVNLFFTSTPPAAGDTSPRSDEAQAMASKILRDHTHTIGSRHRTTLFPARDESR